MVSQSEARGTRTIQYPKTEIGERSWEESLPHVRFMYCSLYCVKAWPLPFPHSALLMIPYRDKQRLPQLSRIMASPKND